VADLEARAHIVISGTVQGVLFRKEMSEKARTLGVGGWVRNLRDGRVEAVAEGERTGIEELLRFCRVGPPGARVTGVNVEWSQSTGEFRGFRIAH
jgi:acylphosphatase